MTDDVTQPSQALVVRPAVLPSLAQLGIERDLAIRLASARGFLPDHYFTGDGTERAAKVLAAIEYGRAVGIEPMIALQNITMIDGKAGASAMLIGAQLRRAGYRIRASWYDDQGVAVPKESAKVHGCKVVLTKNGEETGDGVFSLTDAQRAGLIRERSGWARYPKDMLYARALTQAAREGAQDAVLGMQYTAEELGAEVDDAGQVVSLPPLGGGPVIDGQIVAETPAPGVSEAQVSPPAAAIQPTPPAPSAEPTDESVAGQAAGQTPPAPQTPAPNAVPVAPLAGANISRRLGAGRSISPVRRNVTTVQPPETPATAPEAPAAPAPQPDSVPSQPAPAALTDEPDLPPAPEPADPGKAQFLNDLRGDLRVQTARLFRVNALISNHMADLGVAGKDGKVPAHAEIPPLTPSEASDQALAQRIDADWPGRKLENLGEAELTTLMGRFETNLASKREVLKQRGIAEE